MDPTLNQTPRGLPITLADGKDYLFPPARLGPRGDAVRTKLRTYAQVILQASMISEEIDTALKNGTLDHFAIQAKLNKADDDKAAAFIDLVQEALSENYQNAKEIAENQLTPDIMPVVVSILRSGSYPEDFILPSSILPTKKG